MSEQELLDSLTSCKDCEAVDNAFEQAQITNNLEKIEFLTHCMGDPQIFLGGGDSDNEEEILSQYLTVRSMFITRTWCS